jgi:hypothetical protein
MDTKYYAQAVAEWCKKNPYSKGLPLTPQWLSQMLNRAQELKEEDIAASGEGGAA